VWVWKDDVGQVDAMRASGSYTKSDFARFVVGVTNLDNIIAIHEPE
jgi:hypothetical protein